MRISSRFSQSAVDAEFTDPKINRHKRWRGVLIFAGLIFAAAVAWIFRPHWHPDKSLIESRLHALKKPYRMVDAQSVFDGGSTYLGITDAYGHTEHFFIPCDERMLKVYVMQQINSRAGSIPASDHAATLQELAAILSDHCEDWWDYHNLEKMTGRLGDRLRTKLYEGRTSLAEWWAGQKF